MFLRPRPLQKLLPTTVYSAPKHTPPPYPFRQRQQPYLIERNLTYSNPCPYHQYPRTRTVPATHHQQSGTGAGTIALFLIFPVAAVVLVSIELRSRHIDKKEERYYADLKRALIGKFDVADLTDSYLVMAPNTPAGRPGTLTAVEEQRLRELWAMTIRVFGVDSEVAETNEGEVPASATATDAVSEKDGKKDKKKSRLNVFRRHKDDKGADAKADTASSTSTPDIGRLSMSADEDKFGQTAEFKAALANTPPEELRRTFWSMVKHDHPDALLLRFLRARKWDVEKALIMMISTMHWRSDEMHVDDEVVKNGELAALEHMTSTDAKTKKNSEDFITQLRMGKSFLHGLDNEGRPMCFVRARLHKAGEQTEESLEKFTVYTIETARMLLRPPIDTAVRPLIPYPTRKSNNRARPSSST
jgi:hypothetical protein